jgi:hypothetical protein
MRPYNTYGYSLNDLKNFSSTSKNSTIAGIADKVSRWTEQEKRTYFNNLSLLLQTLQNKGLNIYTNDPEIKKFILSEIKFNVNSENKDIANNYLRVIKKELENGNLNNSDFEEKPHFKPETKTSTINNKTNKTYSNDKDNPNDNFYLNGEVLTEKKDFTIEGLYSLHKRKRLILQPDFQREFVWDKKKSSRLIESLILGFPIPLIYLAEEIDGTFTVIDGQQRLQSVFSYINEMFPDGTSFKLTV